jgi:HEAT repeat protein
MKSSPSTSNREGIRLRVLAPLALLMALTLIAAVMIKSHSSQPAKAPVKDTAAAILSNTTSTQKASVSHPKPLTRAPHPESDPETERLAALLFEKTTPFQVRMQSARALAELGSEPAMAALKSALTNDLPPSLKAAIAEDLGKCPHPEANELLHELVNGKEETVARGAARGLAARGDADAANTLGSLLFNDQTPLSVRTEAALDLGDVPLPAAQDLLTRAIAQIHDDDVLESALDGMGRRPFSDTETFFRNYLNSPDVPADAKVLAIEAVRDADGNVVPFLSNYLNDANPDVRAAAKAAVDFLKPAPKPK